MAEEPNGLGRLRIRHTPRRAHGAVVPRRCRPASDTSGPRLEGPRVTCAKYAFKDIGQVTVALLSRRRIGSSGMWCIFPRTSIRAPAPASLTRYGPPTRTWERGRTLAWAWPSGTQASMTDLCVGKQGCLTVKSKDAADPLAPK